MKRFPCARSDKRIVMNFGGESADFYALRPDEFVALFQEKQGC
jgi:hypothetical protein